MYYDVSTKSLRCLAIGSLASSAITDLDAAKLTGTIDSARLPASALAWEEDSGDIFRANGNVGIGTATPQVSLDLSERADGLALPKGTSAERPATPPAGTIRWNTSTAGLELWNGTAWAAISTGGGGSYLSTSGGTVSGNLTISAGGATISGGVNNNSGGITNAGSITGVGSNITAAGALTVSAGAGNQNLTLNSSGTGAVNLGNTNGASLSVVDGGASTVNYVTVKGAAAGSPPTISAGGADTNIGILFSAKGTGKFGFGTAATERTVEVNGTSSSVYASGGLAKSPISSTSPSLRISNSSPTTGSAAYLEFRTNDSASREQLAYLGSVSASSTGNYAPAIVLGHRVSSSIYSERMRIDAVGRVGIGTDQPNAKLQVNGSLTGPPAGSAIAGSVDFDDGNLKYTDGSCQSFSLSNMKDGSTYSFAVKGLTSALCAFSAYSGTAPTGPLTVHMPPDHGYTTPNKHTMYTFLVMGSDVYVSWTRGL